MATDSATFRDAAPAAPPGPFPVRAAARIGAAALAVAALDQASKCAARALWADGGRTTIVPGFLDLRLALNDGAAWSMLAGRRALLCAVSAAMLAVLAFNLRQLAETRLSRAAAALLAGGILGNLADRIRTGLVVDFIDVHWGSSWFFPTFNLADSAICAGVGLLLIASLPCFRTRPSSSSPRS